MFLFSQISTTKETHQVSLIPQADSGAPPVFGTYARLVSNTTEVVYALPATKPLRGIALLLHACTHNALKFFSPSPTCEQCVGLSEELRISRILLNKGYAILAVTSQNRQSGCWTNPDMSKIRTALEEFQALIPEKVSSVIAIGASSGGGFATEVAANGNSKAALVMVMSLGPVLRERLMKMGDNMPLVYLAPMPHDIRTTSKAKTDYEEMTKILGDSLRVVFDETTCVSLPVSPDFLNERVPHMRRGMAAKIVKALAEAKHLDSNLFFTRDPTRSNWRDVLKESCGDSCLENQSLEPGLSPLAKALHRAWAFHEYCSEVIEKALDFFEKSMLR